MQSRGRVRSGWEVTLPNSGASSLNVLHEKEWQNAGLEAKQAWESSQVGRDFMRDNHFFDDLWKAFEELGDKKMSRFD